MIFKKLFRVYQECQGDNWDGYGAQVISKKAYLEARKLIRLLPFYVKEPEILPEPDGEITLEWYEKPRRVFTVSVRGNNLITYAGLFENTKVHGSEYFGDEIPTIVIEKIKEVLHG